MSCSKTDVLVQHYFVLDGEERHCAAAFSWRLKEHLEDLWGESEFIPGLSRLEERLKKDNSNTHDPWLTLLWCALKFGLRSKARR